MISLLLTILILGLVFSLAVWAVRTLPIPQPFANVALVIIAVIAIVYLLSLLPGFHTFALR